MADLAVKFHPAQLQVFNDPARFKVVVAGRRFGKSYLAAWVLLIEALKSDSHDVYYVAPTFEQGKRILFRMIQGYINTISLLCQIECVTGYNISSIWYIGRLTILDNLPCY